MNFLKKGMLIDLEKYTTILMKYRIRRFKSGGGKSASKHRTIDELINIFLEFCNKYEYHSIGLWRNRNTIGHEYNDEIRKDVFRLSDALNEYNASVDDSNKYLINSYNQPHF